MALRRERMRLGDILIKQNVLTEEQLKHWNSRRVPARR